MLPMQNSTPFHKNLNNEVKIQKDRSIHYCVVKVKRNVIIYIYINRIRFQRLSNYNRRILKHLHLSLAHVKQSN